MSRIVIAFGGNALGNNPKEQQELIKNAVKNVVPLVKQGHDILLNHGNGPQVGVINLAFEDSYENKDIPYMPFPECTAMSQGYIGYHLQKGLRDVLEKEKIQKEIVTLVTQVIVDSNDPSFQNPTKPVGPFYTKEVAQTLMKQTGEIYIEDSGRGYRKVVASPEPLEIVELNSIRTLLETGRIVIAGGGGGIPVFKQGIDKKATAVIDKDLVSSLMGRKLNADILVILTNIKQAELFYGTDHAIKLGRVSVQEVLQYIEEGHFAKGSMLPKIKAAVRFVKGTDHRAIITSLENLSNGLKGIEATEIYDKKY